MMCNHGLYIALTVHDLYDASILYLHVRLYAHTCYVGDEMTCTAVLEFICVSLDVFCSLWPSKRKTLYKRDLLSLSPDLSIDISYPLI